MESSNRKPNSTPRGKGLFLFDIESGGLTTKSSIFSVSHNLNGGQIQTTFAGVEAGSQVSKYVEENIMSLVPKELAKAGTEKELLENVIGTFKSLDRGTTIAGYNSGSFLDFAGEKRTHGFDIFQLAQRADKHGLKDKLLDSVNGLRVRDIGSETALKLAQEISERPDLVESGLYKKAKAYALEAEKFGGKNVTFAEQAMNMSKAGKANMPGWVQEGMAPFVMDNFDSATAHTSAADVQALGALTDTIDKGAPLLNTDEKIKQWSEQTFQKQQERKIVSLANRNIPDPQKGPEVINILNESNSAVTADGSAHLPVGDRALAAVQEEGGSKNPLKAGRNIKRAKSAMYTAGEDVTKGLKGSGAAGLVDDIVEKGAKAILESPGEMWAGISQKIKLHPWIAGGMAIGAIAGTMGIGQLISGNDDDYNTLEGLRHGGHAESMRKQLTDFGSGYQGLSLRGQSVVPEWMRNENIDSKIKQYRMLVEENHAVKQQVEYQRRQEEEYNTANSGDFQTSDFVAKDLRTLEGINYRNKALKVVRLNRFKIDVEDADTIVLKAKGQKDITIRLSGIDAPEVGGHSSDSAFQKQLRINQSQPHGEAATQKLRSILTNERDLSLVIDTGEKTYGRTLGSIVGNGGRNINLDLIRKGEVSALAFGQASDDMINRYYAESLQDQALAQNKGMWQHERWQGINQMQIQKIGSLTHNTFTNLDKLAQRPDLAEYATILERTGSKIGALDAGQRDMFQKQAEKLPDPFFIARLSAQKKKKQEQDEEAVALPTPMFGAASIPQQMQQSVQENLMASQINPKASAQQLTVATGMPSAQGSEMTRRLQASHKKSAMMANEMQQRPGRRHH